MNIDQRLEALTARHEALAQTLELLSGMSRAHEKRMEELDKRERAARKALLAGIDAYLRALDGEGL